MKIAPYLSFDGTCAEAIQFYCDALGFEVAMTQTFGQSPMANQFEGFDDKIMHATLKFGDQTLMASDAPGGFETPQGFRVQIGFADFEEAEMAFAKLAEGGTVTMPFAATFWAKGFGMLTDRFGIPWMVNCDD